MLRLGEWPVCPCRHQCVFFGRFFHCFCFRFSMPDLCTSADLCSTRAAQPSSPSLSAPAAGRRSLVCGLHAPESPLLFDERDGHVPPFSGLARWGRGLRRLFFGWAVLLMARVATRRRLRRNSAVSLLPALCWIFACVFCYGFLCNF
jgi:hypothetical protein